jgi:hypothetical protein
MSSRYSITNVDGTLSIVCANYTALQDVFEEIESYEYVTPTTDIENFSETLDFELSRLPTPLPFHHITCLQRGARHLLYLLAVTPPPHPLTSLPHRWAKPFSHVF